MTRVAQKVKLISSVLLALAIIFMAALLSNRRPPNARIDVVGSALRAHEPKVSMVSGIRVLEHDSVAISRAPKFVVGGPILVAGGVTGTPSFDLTTASSAVYLSDGRLVVSSSMESKIMTFGSDGLPHKVLGARGKGPKEFMRPSNLIRYSDDTLMLVDIANSRLVWLTGDEVIREVSATGGLPASAANLDGVLPGNEIVIHSSYAKLAASSLFRDSATIFLLSSKGETTEAFKVPDLLVGMQHERTGGRSAFYSPTIVRLSGGARIAVWDSSIVAASPERYEISISNTRGESVARLQVLQRRRPVTEQMRNVGVSMELQKLADIREPIANVKEVARLIREAPYADSLPSISRLFVTPNQTLWAVNSIAPTDTGWTATAFSADGMIVGRIEIPFVSTPLSFDDGHVVLRLEDSDGFVSVRVYPIARKK